MGDARRSHWLVGIVALTMILVVGCGGDDDERASGDDPSSPLPTPSESVTPDEPESTTGTVECSSTVTIDLDKYGEANFDGLVEVTVLEVRELPSSIEDPFVNETLTTDAKFVGVRYRVENDANEQLQPYLFGGNFKLTEGSRSWREADYANGQGPVSSAWSVSVGDEQTAGMIGPGFDAVSWSVYEVPPDANPDKLVLVDIDQSTDLACWSLDG